MCSFGALVKNEYLKIIKKTSAKVMFILALLLIIGFPVFLKVVQNKLSSQMYQFAIENDSSMYKSMSAQMSEENTPYYDIKLDLLNFMAQAEEDREPTEANIYQDYNRYDWHYSAVITAIHSDDKQEVQRLALICKTDDWRGYLNYNLSQGGLSETEQWQLKYHLEHDIPPGSDNKDGLLVDQIVNLEDQMEYAEDDESRGKLEAKVKKLRYQLENKIYYETSEKGNLSELGISDNAFWDIYMMTPMLVSFIGYAMIVIAGGIVASEFSQGTIKFLLINPVKRWKILAAKYFTVLSMGAILLTMLFVLSIPIVGLLFGFSEMSAPYLYIKDGTVYQMNSFLAIIRSYLLKSVDMLVVTTLAFALSSVARNSAMAVGFGLGILTLGKTATSLVTDLGFDWARYIIFANTDLETIASGKSLLPEHTVGFAVTVIAVYMFVFLLTAWDGFTKKSL